jgi:hypothetical protein
MAKPLAERSEGELEITRQKYMVTLDRMPELARRIIDFEDQDTPLTSGLEPPSSPMEMHLVTHLHRFAFADEDARAEMVVLARQHLVNLQQQSN